MADKIPSMQCCPDPDHGDHPTFMLFPILPSRPGNYDPPSPQPAEGYAGEKPVEAGPSASKSKDAVSGHDSDEPLEDKEKESAMPESLAQAEDGSEKAPEAEEKIEKGEGKAKEVRSSLTLGFADTVSDVLQNNSGQGEESDKTAGASHTPLPNDFSSPECQRYLCNDFGYHICASKPCMAQMTLALLHLAGFEVEAHRLS